MALNKEKEVYTAPNVRKAQVDGLTRAQRVAARKEAFVKNILNECYKATNMTHGMDKAMAYVDRCCKDRPQERTFYTTCFIEAMSQLKAKLETAQK